MIKIASFSLSEKDLEKLDSLTNSLSLSGRSETIRKSIDLLDLESKSLDKIKGKVSALLITVHAHSKNISTISHHFQNLVKTHIHSHIREHKCMDLFLIEGEIMEITALLNNFRKDKKIFISKLIILN